MQEPRRPSPSQEPPLERGGSWNPSTGWLAAGGGLLLAALVAAWWMFQPAPSASEHASLAMVPLPTPASSAGGATGVAASATAASGAGSAMPIRPPSPGASAPRIARVRGPDSDQSPDITDYINDGEVPTMKEVIERLHRAGVYTGLGAFQPPGTRPPLVGLAVPEDFVLPPGYVRHHQATDDGQRIEAILMFAPDHQLRDAQGRPVPLPEDRVVPPELAPPGLPVRRIVIPPPREPGRP